MFFGEKKSSVNRAMNETWTSTPVKTLTIQRGETLERLVHVGAAELETSGSESEKNTPTGNGL